eukprot:591683_1
MVLLSDLPQIRLCLSFTFANALCDTIHPHFREHTNGYLPFPINPEMGHWKMPPFFSSLTFMDRVLSRNVMLQSIRSFLIFLTGSLLGTWRGPRGYPYKLTGSHLAQI